MNWPVATPFPLNAFPPKLRDLIWELHVNTKAPVEMIAPIVLGAAALAVQNLVNVQRPNCAPSPTSLNILVIAGSGEGKSSVLHPVMQPFHDFQATQAEKFKHQMAEYDAERLAWDAEQKAILATIEKKAKKGESVDELKSRLTALMVRKPRKPQLPKLIYDDATSEAVVHGLCENWPSAAIVSDEASGFFNGRLASDFPIWNKLWDGHGLSVVRRNAGSFSHRSPRCTMLLSIQEGPYRRFDERQGDEAHEIGFLPRFLVACPPSTRGTRFIGNHVLSREALEIYRKRVTDLLSDNVENVSHEEVARENLKFTPEAIDYWVSIYNQIEVMTAPNAPLSDIKAHAAKSPENIARIAAVFHAFEGEQGDISLSTIQCATAVCEWHSNQFKLLFSPSAQIPIEQKDAKTLERWLFDRVWCRGQQWIKRSELIRFGPNALRHGRLDGAAQFLASCGIVGLTINGKAKYVNLNPQHFQNYIPQVP